MVRFVGVTVVKAVNPEGMTVYSLSEIESHGNSRRFVFSNWDDEDTAELEVVATDVEFEGDSQREP